jgi:hypothetical protein
MNNLTLSQNCFIPWTYLGCFNDWIFKPRRMKVWDDHWKVRKQWWLMSTWYPTVHNPHKKWTSDLTDTKYNNAERCCSSPPAAPLSSAPIGLASSVSTFRCPLAPWFGRGLCASSPPSRAPSWPSCVNTFLQTQTGLRKISFRSSASVGLFLSWWRYNTSFCIKLNSMVWVRERTIQAERPPLVGEVIVNFCG